MKARITRGPSTDEGTFGEFKLETGKAWPCIEPPWRGNERGLSCIKADTLRACLVDSPRFKRQVYLLENKNGREAVEIHPLNFAGDGAKGFVSQSHACIGLGRKVGSLDNGEGQMQAAVLQSAKALDELIEATKGEHLEIEIVWDAKSCPPDNPNPLPHGVSRGALQGVKR